jgi:catechol 2,3-dioxygenase-like lactoylglutathione lyase family enzyme
MTPVRPSGLNHLVINVRNMEETHRFWSEMLGFQQVGSFTAGDPSGLQRKMQFYSGDHGGGRLRHHDIAFIEIHRFPHRLLTARGSRRSAISPSGSRIGRRGCASSHSCNPAA